MTAMAQRVADPVAGLIQRPGCLANDRQAWETLAHVGFDGDDESLNTFNARTISLTQHHPRRCTICSP